LIRQAVNQFTERERERCGHDGGAGGSRLFHFARKAG
jgi:hypothetical protein